MRNEKAILHPRARIQSRSLFAIRYTHNCKWLISLARALAMCSVVCSLQLRVDLPTASTYLPMDPSRHFFLSPNITYMNVATLGPMPKHALLNATKAWTWLEGNPAERYDWNSGPSTSRMDAVRSLAAKILGVPDIDDLALVQSTTIALHMVASGLVSTRYLERGRQQRVLTTDMEHPGGVAAWRHYVKMGILEGIDQVALPAPATSEEEVVDLFASAFRRPSANYAVVSVSHVLTTTGMILPLKQIADIAHRNGALLVVDGAQAAGSVNVNISATGADAYTISGHKGLLGPTGSGLLYVRSTTKQHIQPAALGLGYDAYTQASGTIAMQTIIGLGCSLEFIAAAGGLAAVVRHGQDLAASTLVGLQRLASEIPGLRPLSPTQESGMSSSIVTVAMPPGVRVQDVIPRLLDEKGRFVVKELPDNGGGTPLVVNALRVSYHMYNSNDDVGRFLLALQRILQDMICSGER